MLKGRADLLQPQGIHIRHNGHTVGVAHIDAGDPPEVIVHFQWDIHQRCTSHVHSGQVGGQSAVGPHLHLPQSLAPAGDGLEAAEGINGQLLLLHTVGVQPLGHAADAVAILPSLPSALKMRIMASAPAVRGAQMQMMPSAPMEKCRRDSFSERAAMFSGTPAVRQSR